MNWKTKTDKIKSELCSHQFKFDVSVRILFGLRIIHIHFKITNFVCQYMQSKVNENSIGDTEDDGTNKELLIKNCLDADVFQLNDSLASTVTNSTVECSTFSESEPKSERVLNYLDYDYETMMRSKTDGETANQMYKTMSESMSLLQTTKRDILKIFEDQQNRLQNHVKTDFSSDEMPKMCHSVEKRHKEILARTIKKIRSNVDDLERVSRLF